MLEPGPINALIIARFNALGFVFEKVQKRDVNALRDFIGSNNPPGETYFNFLERVGVLNGPCKMLRPNEVIEACLEQQCFYDDSSFGEEPEDELIMKLEQDFRSSLIPFQNAMSGGDFYCFVSGNRLSADGDPLILDVYHDDFELAGIEIPTAETPYSRDFIEHLSWVADRAATTHRIFCKSPNKREGPHQI